MTAAEPDDRRQVAVRNLEHEIGTLLRRIRKGLSERAVQVHPELNATSYLLLTTLSEHGACRAAHLAVHGPICLRVKKSLGLPGLT